MLCGKINIKTFMRFFQGRKRTKNFDNVDKLYQNGVYWLTERLSSLTATHINSRIKFLGFY